MTASNGAVVWSAKYSSFGKAQVAPESTVVNNLRFPGQYFDSESGLHYNWHRYYDPGTGRYLRVDPIGLKGGLNLFIYARSNPIKYGDVKGLMGCSPPSPDDSQEEDTEVPERPDGKPRDPGIDIPSPDDAPDSWVPPKDFTPPNFDIDDPMQWCYDQKSRLDAACSLSCNPACNKIAKDWFTHCLYWAGNVDPYK